MSYDGILFADGFDEAIIGVASRFEPDGVTRSFVVYDYCKCLDVLMRRDEMTYEDALEYLEFNVICA